MARALTLSVLAMLAWLLPPRQASAFIIIPSEGPVVTNVEVQGTPGSFYWNVLSFTHPDSVSRGNDNVSFRSDNEITLLDLEFLTNDHVDLVLTVQSATTSTPATEYALGIGTDFQRGAASIVNKTDTAWSGFQIQVGVLGAGGNLVPVSGLDFDAPDLDPLPISDVFTLFQHWGHTINFLGPSEPIPGGGAEGSHFVVAAGLDIPNLATDTVIIRMRPLLFSQIGMSSDNPILPDEIDPETGGFVFRGRTGGRWFDPPAYGFHFVMDTPSAGFNTVTLPPFFDPVLVTYGMTSVIGNPLDTISLGGVTSFTITGINPPADSDNPASYPVFLTFTTSDPVNFRMIPLDPFGNPIAVPEPASLFLCGSGLAIGLGLTLRRRRAAA